MRTEKLKNKSTIFEPNPLIPKKPTDPPKEKEKPNRKKKK